MQQAAKARISWRDYLDKVWGGWFGKCLGGAAGAPLEGWKRIPDISSFEEVFDPKIPNDDLDIQLLWLELLETKGLNFSGEDMARYWDEKCHYMYSEYGYFMKNYKRGIYPPLSGSFNNSFFKEGMGCPIRSEIWGMIFPGDPENAARFAELDGSLDHAGDSVWAEKFLAAIESMAFFVSDIDRLIDIGLEYVPAGSRFYEMATMVREMHRSGKSWRETADEVCRRFGHHDFTNSIQNMGFILIALLNGRADANSFCGVVSAYEDLIPLDQLNGIQGQVCYYLESIVYFKEDSPAWLVIGNNDGFRLYLNKKKVIERDEIRLWTPYNNSALVRFKKGANHIVIKLLRRTENLKFSIGIRQSLSAAGYHGQRWYTDLVYTISDKDNTGRKE